MDRNQYKLNKPDNFYFDLQQFAGEGDGDEGKPGGGEVFSRTTKEGKIVKIPKSIEGVDVEALFDSHMAAARKDGSAEATKKQNDIIEKVKSLEVNNSELQAMIQKLEDDKLTAEERVQKEAKREREKVMADLEKEKKRADSSETKYKNLVIETQVLRELGKHEPKVINHEQVLELMVGNGRAKLVEDDESMKVLISINDVDGEKVELGVKEAIAKWLEKPENYHFLEATMTPGGGTPQITGGRFPRGVDLSKLSAEQRLAAYYAQKSAKIS